MQQGSILEFISRRSRHYAIPLAIILIMSLPITVSSSHTSSPTFGSTVRGRVELY
ncbi:MAG: hypothetical protein ABSA50_09900 [Candidatus Bathyarchaeia archaeon]